MKQNETQLSSNLCQAPSLEKFLIVHPSCYASVVKAWPHPIFTLFSSICRGSWFLNSAIASNLNPIDKRTYAWTSGNRTHQCGSGQTGPVIHVYIWYALSDGMYNLIGIAVSCSAGSADELQMSHLFWLRHHPHHNPFVFQTINEPFCIDA